MSRPEPFHPESFGIIGAMDAEIEQLKAAMSHVQQQNVGSNTVYTGLLDGKNVSLCLSGIGKVNAAIATTLLIEHFGPDCIINTGSAGGIGHGLRIGDIVIGNEIAHHDVDVTAFGYAYGQVPKMQPRYPAHRALLFAAEAAADTLSQLRCRIGLIASGDQFVHGDAQIALIKQHFPDIAAVEMEAAAIAQTCERFGKPFLIIRAVSDSADSGAEISFEEFLPTAAAHSAQLVRKMMAAF